MVDTLTIDDLDRQLAQCLGVDGRASFSQLAVVLGVSDQTVARRYRRLRSAGVMRVVGLKAQLWRVPNYAAKASSSPST